MGLEVAVVELAMKKKDKEDSEIHLFSRWL